MSKDKTGGPAFPMQYDDGSWQCGITLRDYLAAKAMQGALACDVDDPLTAAIYAYKVADAMLEARKL